MYNLLEFLKTGSYFGATVGMKQDFVVKNLNNMQLGLQMENSEFYFYSLAQLLFVDDILRNIIVSGHAMKGAHIGDSTGSISIGRWTSVNAMVRTLNKFGIVWTFSREVLFEKSLGILTEGGVYILFDSDGRPELGKIGI